MNFRSSLSTTISSRYGIINKTLTSIAVCKTPTSITRLFRKSLDPERAANLITTRDYLCRRQDSREYRLCSQCPQPPDNQACYVKNCFKHKGRIKNILQGFSLDQKWLGVSFLKRTKLHFFSFSMGILNEIWPNGNLLNFFNPSLHPK